jgi:chemotaxis protein MotB
MEANGLRPNQVAEVRGYADRRLRHPEDPDNPSNRRISVIVQYVTEPDKKEPAKKEPAKK